MSIKIMAEDTNDIDMIISNLLSQSSKIKRMDNTFEKRSGNILDEVVANQIEEKSLPLALRKRLMYQRVLSA
ncbi:hypothetical protein IJO12_03215 [bacterium]|nr:hypothetical protein [bacterium]